MNIRSTSTLSATPVSVHVQRALLKPLPERCRELTQLLRETSHKDLNTLYPQLVEHVYGFGHQAGWGLLSLTRSVKPQDFDSAFHFLAPDGPLFLMAYRLLGDGHTRYEFPVSSLPVSSQRLLEEGDIPLLYNNKVPYCGPGRTVSHVLLNPFEYYIFHFIYSILNPTHPKVNSSSINSDLVDCLYVVLLDTYLSHFLPLNDTPVPSLPIMGQQPPFRSPRYASSLSCSLPVSLSSFPGSHHQMSCMFGSSSSPMSVGGLLKRPTVMSPSSSSSPTTASAQEELWRSEFLVLALTEFWLSLSPNVEANSFSTLFQGTFLPGSLHIQLVRLLIKHIHLFSNSGVRRSDTSLDATTSVQQSAWDAFKCQVIPQLLQRKLYTFFRLTFERWPLDASFRLPLETWLSYIQPWRYVEQKPKDQTHHKDQIRSVGYHWQTFITENLLFYSVLFQQLLPRFFRMELNSPKNSFLLFRVTKVFSQTNLQPMISEVEALLQETCSSQLPNSNQFLSLTTLNQLRQFVVETEGYNYHYVPMFGEQGRETASNLLELVISAGEMAAVHASDLERSQPGFLHSVLNWMFSQEDCQGGLTLTESQRVTMHLDLVAGQLCQIFQLAMPAQDGTPIKGVQAPRIEANTSRCWEFKEKLRPKSIKEVHFRGNPDRQPIRTFEVAFLVRMFHQMSTFLNEKYQNELNSVYMRPDWLGGLSRQFLREPVMCYDDQDQQVALPPRLCLRVLANKELLLYFISFYILLYLAAGCSLFSYLVMLTVLMLVYASIKASFDYRRRTI